jgi:amidophosphoribosyltransferase
VCGIIAIYSEQDSAQTLYQGLLQLQHRGQDAAGLVTLGDGFSIKRGLGRVDEVFHPDVLARFRGTLGIGHTRYATSGGYSSQDIQPFYSNEQEGIALAHSGHLHSNSWMIPFQEKAQSKVDSNLLLQFLLTLLQDHYLLKDNNAFFSLLCHVVTVIMHQVPGSYSVVGLIADKGLLVFRDSQGIRPLIMGARINSFGKKEYLFASESHFFNDLGFHIIEDVPPGEVIFVSVQGDLYRHSLLKNKPMPCSFEYVYFAKASSIIDGILVEDSRRRMGELLALRWQQSYSHLKPDFVLPIPNTANTAALAFAQKLGFNYHEYFKVNIKVGRSFIHADPLQRDDTIGNKLSINADKVKNKIILLFDDSIVRGITAAHLVKKLKAQGAKHIYFVCACPPIVNICVYGINIPTKNELLAATHSQEKIKQLLDVDELLYPNPQDLINTIYLQNPASNVPCIKCMKK